MTEFGRPVSEGVVTDAIGAWLRLVEEHWGQVERDARAGSPLAAEQLFERSACLLVETLERSDAHAGARVCVHAAALALEAGAMASQMPPPLVGESRRLLRNALEKRLVEQAHDALAGEGVYQVRAELIDRLARRARTRARRVVVGSCGRARDLDLIEETALELAATALRCAANVSAFGVAVGPGERDAQLDPQIQVIVAEVLAHSKRLAASGPPSLKRAQAGRAIGGALRLVFPRMEIQLLDRRGVDRSLRADALSAVRARWGVLAGCELLAALALDGAPGTELFSDEELLAQAAVIASVAVRGSGIALSPSRFDHRRAWLVHRGVLIDVMTLLLTVGQEHGAGHARRRLADRIGRAAASIWTLDAQLGGTRA